MDQRHETHGIYQDVIEALDANTMLDEAVHEMDNLLKWNCRHVDNAATKPVVHSLRAVAGYPCPEICTPLELLPEEPSDV